jgi:hypothetical protein
MRRLGAAGKWSGDRVPSGVWLRSRKEALLNGSFALVDSLHPTNGHYVHRGGRCSALG